MNADRRVHVDLSGVSETLLWTLHHRAAEARRPDAVLSDPLAVDLVDRLDYPFRETFGPSGMGQGQGQALRVLRFDTEIRDFLATHPAGQVVALGEGLETQFWRVDNGSVRWLSVDLPAVVELRREVLPAEPRMRSVAMSALDERWMDEVDAADGLLVSAQGLFMYLPRERVYGLITTLADRFGDVRVVFDAAPRWFAALTRLGLRLPSGFRIPPMPWGIDPAELRRLRGLHPGLVEVRDLRLPVGRGLLYGGLYGLVYRLPVIRDHRLWILSLRFEARRGDGRHRSGSEKVP